MSNSLLETPAKLHVVTASLDFDKTREFWPSWKENSKGPLSGHILVNGSPRVPNSEVDLALFDLIGNGTFNYTPEVMGTVPAFAKVVEGIDCQPHDIICLFHDDLRIDEDGWNEKILDFFEEHRGCVHVGLGGAIGVGRAEMYAQPFDPMTLARHGFRSNMIHAEAHGIRVTEPERVAVMDGFSLIGRAWLIKETLQLLTSLGVTHHAYDLAFGLMAKRRGLESWLLPIKCHHHGGMNATSSAYLDWANKNHGGDGEIWLQAHRAVYNEFRNELPFHV